jgi:hypothetical protein
VPRRLLPFLRDEPGIFGLSSPARVPRSPAMRGIYARGSWKASRSREMWRTRGNHA